ncbi:response regulator, putative [Syntrophotalea carbinolica DSM 2380]|uniref:Response regulator, putative n=1 Tax=Syntrophotalea carbinolica (strain DSM 2380 / NBRC 103641 / GraBd1) TaxID=338963 RepID=Q3A0B3_SYNC1|nr:response regulator [Syntrophotalea carbinolica]ABA90194.1 response regulator, putative [Syntrophotalea carbinolica DSM 2380]
MTRLLVVDDEQDIRYLFQCELEEEGYHVDAAGSAAEAERFLRENRYDLVVLDIQIGGDNGLAMLQDIIGRQKDLPVILCTAFSCYKEDFSSWLADGYVVKSSDLSELKSEIQRVLTKKGKLPSSGRPN